MKRIKLMFDIFRLITASNHFHELHESLRPSCVSLGQDWDANLNQTSGSRHSRYTIGPRGASYSLGSKNAEAAMDLYKII